MFTIDLKVATKGSQRLDLIDKADKINKWESEYRGYRNYIVAETDRANNYFREARWGLLNEHTPASIV